MRDCAHECAVRLVVHVVSHSRFYLSANPCECLVRDDVDQAEERAAERLAHADIQRDKGHDAHDSSHAAVLSILHRDAEHCVTEACKPVRG